MRPAATGKIARLFTDARGTSITLDIAHAQAPANNYFLLERTHENYNALYALALAAAANRWPLTIRIEGEVPIPGIVNAIVQYFVVDWPGNQTAVD